MQLEVDLSRWQPVAIIFLVIVAVFLFFLAYRKIKRISREPLLYGLDKEGIKKRWARIENLLEEKSETNYKLAVIEADTLLNYVLRSMAIPGKDLGERLKFASYKYPKLRAVWPAHKTRNRLVHQANFHLDYQEAQKTLSCFKQALKELNFL